MKSESQKQKNEHVFVAFLSYTFDWCSTDKCLLRCCAVYSGAAFFDYIQRNAFCYLFHRFYVNDDWCLAFIAG